MIPKILYHDTKPLFSQRLVLIALMLVLAVTACMPLAAAATVSSVNPVSGPVAGGTPVTISGSGFVRQVTYTLDFGGVQVTAARSSNNALAATTPAHMAGTVTVTVYEDSVSQGSVPGGFTYVESPAYTSLTPTSGPATGGTSVTITGTNLAGATEVTFGGTEATITDNSATHIMVTTPAHAAGSVDVVITTPGGSTTGTSAFTYVVMDIPSAGVTGFVAPATGAVPPAYTTLSPGSADYYTVTGLTWAPTDNPYAASTVYTATVTLTSAAGYKFPVGGIALPTVNTGTPSAGTTSGGDVSGNTLIFTVTFPATGTTSVTDILSVDVYALEHPVAGVEPTTVELLQTDSAEYTMTGLSWSPAHDLFEDSTVYVATIMLTSATGYKFPVSGIPQPLVHVNGILIWGATPSAGTTAGGDVSGNTLTFTVTYPLIPITGNITSAGVTGFVAPATGAAPHDFSTLTPVVTPATGDYNITGLTWSPAVTTTYAGSTVYTAMVTLMSNATSGYKFPATGLTPAVNAGTPAAGTTHGGDVSGNTLTFNVTFPLTEGGDLTFSSITPGTGPVAGGTAVTIRGTNFADGGLFGVTIGGTAATSVAWVNATTITAVTPAGTTGAQDVVITNNDGQLVTGFGAFTYAGPASCDIVPMVGAWTGASIDTAGLYQKSTGMFFLKNSNVGGDADLLFQYGAGGDDWSPLIGDWDADSDDTVGLYQTSIGAYFVKNSNGPGDADLVFPYGAGGDDWIQLAGDWDGDGDDTVGAYQKSIGYFFLKNSNEAGPADLEFQYGAGGDDWSPLIGDWDADGDDTVGLYQTSIGAYFVKNSNGPGDADLVFPYGAGGDDWIHLAGDWDGDGNDTVGAYQQSIGVFFLKNTNGPGDADTVFQFGPGCSDR